MTTQQRRSVSDALDEKQQPATAADTPGTELARRPKDLLDEIVEFIAPEIEKQIVKAIPADTFLRTVETGLRRSPALAAIAKDRAGRRSLYAAMLEAARWGLVPFTKEGAIVPFGKTATFIPQWQGLVKTIYRSGDVSAVEAHLIHLHDEWDLAYGDSGGFFHRPALIDRATGEPLDRGPAVLAYCYVVHRDGTRTAVTTVTRQEAIENRDRYSKSYARTERIIAEIRANKGAQWEIDKAAADSAWHTDFPGMWLKTAIRKHYDVAPSSTEQQQIFTASQRDDVMRPLAAEPPVWEGTVVGDDFVDAEWIAADDDAQPPPPDEPEQQPAEPFDRAKEMRHLHALFGDCGLGGREHQATRTAVAQMLARETPQAPPVPQTLSQLSDAQLARVIAKLGVARVGADGELQPADEVRAGLERIALLAKQRRGAESEQQS
jgi:recombination protein RecT